MVFVQYFHNGTTGKLIEACGDRAVVILDGRNNLATWKADAVKFNGFRRPNYLAYQIFKGDHMLAARPITPIINL